MKGIAKEIEGMVSFTSKLFGGPDVKLVDWQCTSSENLPTPEITTCIDPFCVSGGGGSCAEPVQYDTCQVACEYLGEEWTNQTTFFAEDTSELPLLYSGDLPHYSLYLEMRDFKITDPRQRDQPLGVEMGNFGSTPDACALMALLFKGSYFRILYPSGACRIYTQVSQEYIDQGETVESSNVLVYKIKEEEGLDQTLLRWKPHVGQSCTGDSIKEIQGTRGECALECEKEEGCHFFQVGYGVQLKNNEGNLAGGRCILFRTCSLKRHHSSQWWSGGRSQGYDPLRSGWNVWERGHGKRECRVSTKCGPHIDLSVLYKNNAPVQIKEGDGAAQGAATGAAIGTFFGPGLGTAIGAGIGAAVGSGETKYKTENRFRILPKPGAACTGDALCLCSGEEGFDFNDPSPISRCQRAVQGNGQSGLFGLPLGEGHIRELLPDECQALCEGEGLHFSLGEPSNRSFGCWVQGDSCTYQMISAEALFEEVPQDKEALQAYLGGIPQEKYGKKRCAKAPAVYHTPGGLAQNLWATEQQVYGLIPIVQAPPRGTCAEDPRNLYDCWSACAQVWKRALEKVGRKGTPASFRFVEDQDFMGACSLRIFTSPAEVQSICTFNLLQGDSQFTDTLQAREVPVCLGLEGRRRLVEEVPSWGGNTKCDRLWHAQQVESLLEKEILLECLEARTFGIKLKRAILEWAKVDLPLEDISYNWRRKWEVAGGLLGGFAHLHSFRGGGPWEGDPKYTRLAQILEQHLWGALGAGGRGVLQEVERNIPNSTKQVFNRSIQLLDRFPSPPKVHLGLDIAEIFCPGIPCFKCLVLSNILQEIFEEGERMVQGFQVWTKEDIPRFLEDKEQFGKCLLPQPLLVEPPLRDRLSIFDIPSLPVSTLKQFFTQLSGEPPVPRFGRSLPWTLRLSLGECRGESLMCELPERERLARIDDSLLAVGAWLIVVCLLPFLLGGLPLPLMAVLLPLTTFFASLVSLNWVWGWSLLCFPRVPTCILRDVSEYIQGRLIPRDFAALFPSLTLKPENITCHAPNGTLGPLAWAGGCHCTFEAPTFQERCSELPGFDSLAYTWAPLAWMRIELPDLLLRLRDLPPFSSLLQLSPAYEKIMSMPITPLLRECAYVRLPDLILLLVAVYSTWSGLIGLVSVIFALGGSFGFTGPPFVVFLSDLLDSLLG